MRPCHRRFACILALLVSINYSVYAAHFCASDGDTDPPTPTPADMCTNETFHNIQPPHMNNSNGGIYKVHDCNMAFLLDLGTEWVTQEAYENIGFFLYETTVTCLDRGVGYNIKAMNMFNKSNLASCCGDDGCQAAFGFMAYNDFVVPYNDAHSKVFPETATTNFTISLVQELKRFKGCLYNNVVLVTNRLFGAGSNNTLAKEIEEITDYKCVTFTIILVGRHDISMQLLHKTYGKLTSNIYLVPGLNCLENLKDCIKPCGPRSQVECEQEELTNCPLPTPPQTTDATTTLSVSTTTEVTLDEYWHIIYLFALSDRTTNDEFTRAMEYIGGPILDCKGKKVVVRFLAVNGSTNEDSNWVVDLELVDEYLSQLKFEELILPADHTVDIKEQFTLQLLRRAVSLNIKEDSSVNGPRITLLTDFVSKTFIDTYNNRNDPLMTEMQQFDFEIIAFDKETADYYKMNTTIRSQHIHPDPDFGDSSRIVLCPKNTPGKPKGSSTILFIIIGTCAGFMLLLVLCTVIYRQKYMWMEKLNRFRDDNKEDKDTHSDIVDHWELDAQKVVIKSEQLGHGAYGLVFKGKLLGVSPCIERFHHTEAKRYTDCECAVKRLPKFASEKHVEEFLHEIDLMKSLGYHENIVNMLGCISAGPKSSLVLEFCANRDLLRFIKQRKAELEISRSIDEQIDCTKEFMNFAWQVAQGMRFLGQQHVIHRDLAARNILITDDAVKTAKIGDFGLAIDERAGSSAASAAGRLPIKWLAIESLTDKQFSVKSDVWSFGIVLFEMYSMGESPYSDIEPSDLIHHLQAGHRPRRPLLAGDKISEVMSRCWDTLPSKRPSFDELLTIFTILLEQATEGYGYLALIKSDTYKRLSHLDGTTTVPEGETPLSYGMGLRAQSESSIDSSPMASLPSTPKASSVYSTMDEQSIAVRHWRHRPGLAESRMESVEESEI